MICYNNVKGVVHVSIVLCHWFFAIDSFMEPDCHTKRGFCVKVWLHEAIQLNHWGRRTSLASNPGFPFWILSCSFAKLLDKIWNGKPGFKARTSQ